MAKVLLAEDESMIRELIATFLDSIGFEVIEAQNGKDALEKARQISPDSLALLITDLVMPVMGGLELANELHKTHPKLRVLYISGYTDEVVPAEREQRERSRFLRKPFNLQALQRQVEELLEAA